MQTNSLYTHLTKDEIIHELMKVFISRAPFPALEVIVNDQQLLFIDAFEEERTLTFKIALHSKDSIVLKNNDIENIIILDTEKNKKFIEYYGLFNDIIKNQ